MGRIDEIPTLLAQYVKRAVPDPLAAPSGTVLHQRGEIRLDPQRDWMPFTAEQTLAASRTEFVWHARFKMAPLVTGVVEDAFENGEGRLDAKIWGMIPVAHARGIEVDRGERQRYLAEMAWCPLAFVHNAELHFEELGDRRVRVWVADPQTYVDLRFDEAGDIVAASTNTRSRGEDVQPWEGRFSDYRDFGGIRAPSRGEVSWFPAQGEFLYWRAEILDLAFDEAD